MKYWISGIICLIVVGVVIASHNMRSDFNTLEIEIDLHDVKIDEEEITTKWTGWESHIYSDTKMIMTYELGLNSDKTVTWREVK